jgi:hypothetical protein
MANEKKYTFHLPGNDYRGFLGRKERGVLAKEGVDASTRDMFSRFRRVDRLFVNKYGCVRCPHKGTRMCPYGVGQSIRHNKPYTQGSFEEVREVTGKPDDVEVTKTEYTHGICPERTRELGFFANNVSNMNGLLAERAESLQKIKDVETALYAALEDIMRDPKALMVKDKDGDIRAIRLVEQLTDLQLKKEQLVKNSIDQQIKFEELKSRDRNELPVLDVTKIKERIEQQLGTRKDGNNDPKTA